MTKFDRNDVAYMQMALALAARGRNTTQPNPMVGAVVVRGDGVVGRGYHVRAGEAHAEVIALREAADKAEGATLYVTLEPCCHFGRTPPCVDQILQAGVSRVVVAMLDPNPLVSGQGVARLREEGLTVHQGCLEREARRLNEFFVTFHEKKRPFLTLKWAMTACGRTSHDTGQSRWISNEASREYVHRLRSQHEGLMVGVGTVLTDDPMLNVRLPDYDGRQPKKLIIDGDLSIPTRARLMRDRKKSEVILFTTPFADPAAIEFFENLGCRVVVTPSRRRLLDLNQVMTELARLEVQSVLVEGGRQIHTSLLQRGLVDKVVVFISPKIIGGAQLRNPIENLRLNTMEDAFELNELSFHNFDGDVCLEGYITHK